MNILSAEQISKSHGEKTLFAPLTLGIGTGERIGVIGVNGTGKSTLLKVLAGVTEPDSGRVTVGRAMRVRYLAQDVQFAPEMTVLDAVFNGDTPALHAIRAYEETLQNLSLRPDDEHLQQRMTACTALMDAADAWQQESLAKAILMQLGVTEMNANVTTLSGGQQKRIAIAQALIDPSDLLIMDEPTNHIDEATTAWLEQHLRDRKGALLLVTHDRYFLDRVTNRIIELDRGQLYSYPGNYSQFLTLKTARMDQTQASEQKRQNLWRRELAWMQRGAKARSTKQKARIERFEAIENSAIDTRESSVDISVGASRLGNKVFVLQNVAKSYAVRPLIADFSYTVLPTDRIGVIGQNGMGKSTLLKILADKLIPDAGIVEVGSTVKIGYFAQESLDLNPELRVLEVVREIAEHMQTADGHVISASQMLERFLFPPDLQWTPIGKLSGGEKRRLQLLRTLVTAPNVLLLDEPTNDLDIQTLTVLEEYIDEFPGVVIAVSHDRYFLDRVAEKIFAFEGGGRITQHFGNYTDYVAATMSSATSVKGGVAQTKSPADSQSSNQLRNHPSSHQEQSDEIRKRDRKLKMTYAEEKEFAEIEERISALEAGLTDVEMEMGQAGADYVRLQELMVEKERIEHDIEYAMERWTYLTDLHERISEGE